MSLCSEVVNELVDCMWIKTFLFDYQIAFIFFMKFLGRFWRCFFSICNSASVQKCLISSIRWLNSALSSSSRTATSDLRGGRRHTSPTQSKLSDVGGSKVVFLDSWAGNIAMDKRNKQQSHKFTQSCYAWSCCSIHKILHIDSLVIITITNFTSRK